MNVDFVINHSDQAVSVLLSFILNKEHKKIMTFSLHA